MKLILISLFCIISGCVLAQQKKYNVAFSYGVYTAPTLKQSHFKDYFLVDFNYHLTEKWIITSGFISGKFNYYDNIRSNADTEITKYTTSNTNARGYDMHTYIMAKYAVVATKRFILEAATGVGMLTQRLKYPYREPCSSGCAVFIGEVSNTTLEFPIKAEVHYSLTDQINVGIIGGGFVKLNSSDLGFHFGPQVRVSF